MIFIVTKYLTPKGYQGMAVYPFVFMREEKNKENFVFVNHESIHLRQQLELLILPFFIWYILEFMFRWIQFKDFDLAYRNICFEREAYGNQSNRSYLQNRKPYQFLKYLIQK